jgi:hypothetical protein
MMKPVTAPIILKNPVLGFNGDASYDHLGLGLGWEPIVGWEIAADNIAADRGIGMLLKTLRPGIGACLLAGILSAGAHAQPIASISIPNCESDGGQPSTLAQIAVTATLVSLVVTENPDQASSSRSWRS